MSNDLVKRIDEFEEYLEESVSTLLAQVADRIEILEMALFNIYVAPNDQSFIKSQIESVLDINEYRQKWGEKKNE